MNNLYSEVDVTWSSIEKYYQYSKVNWHIGNNGIPIYVLIDESGKEIDINAK